MNIDLFHQLAITVLVPLLTQLVKKVQFIPIEAGQKARIRTFVGVVTVSLTLLTAWLDGNLTGALTPDMIQVGVASAITFILAHLGFQGTKTIVGKLNK